MLIFAMIFKSSGPYTIEFLGGPKDGEFACVPGDWPDRVVCEPDSVERAVIYERCENDPCRYRFRGWAVRDTNERNEH